MNELPSILVASKIISWSSYNSRIVGGKSMIHMIETIYLIWQIIGIKLDELIELKNQERCTNVGNKRYIQKPRIKKIVTKRWANYYVRLS